MSQFKYRSNRTSGRRLLPSFTLVELLIAITIMGIMIGMVLYTLAGARRDSLTARTRGTIKKINDIVLARWEEFRYRAVKVNVPDDYLLPTMNMGVGVAPTAPLSPREGARLRMIILRDVMRMEFPDRWNDLLSTPTYYKAAVFTSDNGPPTSNTMNDQALFLDRTVPGVYDAFRRKVGLPPVGGTVGATAPLITIAFPLPPASPNPPLPVDFPTRDFQMAELLYMIVANTNMNGTNGLEYFRPSEIDDKDGDGFPEFIDAWGNPIFWLRWPAGYGVVDSTTMTADQMANSVPPDAAMNDRTVPDPLDPLRTDWRWTHPAFANASKPWMLVPLIVSAGPDGVFDLKFEYGAANGGEVHYAQHTWTLGGTGSPGHFMGTPAFYSYPDPYYRYYDTSSNPVVEGRGGLGEWQDDDGNPNTFGAQDNITNYSLLLE